MRKNKKKNIQTHTYILEILKTREWEKKISNIIWLSSLIIIIIIMMMMAKLLSFLSYQSFFYTHNVYYYPKAMRQMIIHNDCCCCYRRRSRCCCWLSFSFPKIFMFLEQANKEKKRKLRYTLPLSNVSDI